MRFFLFCLMVVFLIQQAPLNAQKRVTIAGIVLDTTEKPLIAATVVLLQLPDSSFAEYGLTTDLGEFRLEGKRDSSYLLQISYLGYSSYQKKITPKQDTSFGKIILQERANTLDGIEVNAEHIPVRMKGDTLEFNAAAFHVGNHDDVEKLLQQLPGLEFLEDGSITLNGKKITEILVDGKEFFGENAQAVLKSLPADAIKKIEIANTKEKKDGIDTNNDEKTIDLKLKEEAKKGFLGQIEGGYGYPNHRYKGGLSLNYFNPKIRLTVFGGINNINQSALAFERQNVYGNARQRAGITRAIAGGFNANLFLSEKTQLNLTYMYNNDLTTVDKTAFSQSILPENIYTRNSSNNNLSSSQRHYFYTKLLYKFDKTQKLQFILRFRYQQGGQEQHKNETTAGLGDTLQNSLAQLYNNKSDNFTISPNLFYQKKFKKKGREFSARVNLNFIVNSSSSDNNSLTNFYNDSGLLTQIDTLRQEQLGQRAEQACDAIISFKEPVGDKNDLEFDLYVGGRNSENERSAFDIFTQTKIENTSLSDSYQKFQNHQEFKTSFKRKTDNYFFKISLGFSRNALEGRIASNPSPIIQDFYYPTGSFRFRYFFTKSKRITFNYNTRFTIPRIEQLQPIVNNNDPLSTSIGNPNLLPEYSHALNLRVDLWEQLTFTNFYTSIYINFIQNSIIQATILDENFRLSSQPINSGLSYRGGSYLGYSTAIKKLLKINLKAGVSLYQGPIIINGILLGQFNHDYNANLIIGNRKKEIIDASIAAKVVVGNSIYESNSALNVSYVNHSYSANFRVTIAKKWQIKTQFNYQIYANAGFGEAIAIPIWSAGISRTFLKSDALKIEFTAENLLNEGKPVQFVGALFYALRSVSNQVIFF